MPEYTPPDMPEVSVNFSYLPAEYQGGYMVERPDVELHTIFINGEPVSMSLEELLIETFGSDWEVAIMRMANKRRVAWATYFHTTN